jgi:SAM-dependent methyltransferase
VESQSLEAARQFEGMRRWGRRNAGLYSLWAGILSLAGYRRMIRRIVEGLPAVGTAIDVGCGDGEALRLLASLRPGLRVVALDISPEFLARAHRRHPRALLVCADAKRLPIRARTCDVALSLGVLGHLIEPEEAIAQQVGVLRPGGTLALWTRTRGFFSRLISAVFECGNPGVAFLLHDPAGVLMCLERHDVTVTETGSVAGGVLIRGRRTSS